MTKSTASRTVVRTKKTNNTKAPQVPPPPQSNVRPPPPPPPKPGPKKKPYKTPPLPISDSDSDSDEHIVEIKIKVQPTLKTLPLLQHELQKPFEFVKTEFLIKSSFLAPNLGPTPYFIALNYYKKNIKTKLEYRCDVKDFKTRAQNNACGGLFEESLLLAKVYNGVSEEGVKSIIDELSLLSEFTGPKHTHNSDEFNQWIIQPWGELLLKINKAYGRSTCPDYFTKPFARPDAHPLFQSLWDQETINQVSSHTYQVIDADAAAGFFFKEVGGFKVNTIGKYITKPKIPSQVPKWTRKHFLEIFVFLVYCLQGLIERVYMEHDTQNLPFCDEYIGKLNFLIETALEKQRNIHLIPPSNSENRNPNDDLHFKAFCDKLMKSFESPYLSKSLNMGFRSQYAAGKVFADYLTKRIEEEVVIPLKQELGIEESNPKVRVMDFFDWEMHSDFYTPDTPSYLALCVYEKLHEIINVEKLSEDWFLGEFNTACNISVLDERPREMGEPVTTQVIVLSNFLPCFIRIGDLSDIVISFRIGR